MTVEELDACFIVQDHNGQALAYVYFEDEPGHIAFIAYGIALNLLPVLILHVVLLPLNGWRLVGALKQHNAIVVKRHDLAI